MLVDALTGKSEVIKLEDVPEFIDGAVSPETVSLQNSYFGNYVHGFWNSKFGKKDVKLPSDEGTEENVSPILTRRAKCIISQTLRALKRVSIPCLAIP